MRGGRWIIELEKVVEGPFIRYRRMGLGKGEQKSLCSEWLKLCPCRKQQINFFLKLQLSAGVLRI